MNDDGWRRHTADERVRQLEGDIASLQAKVTRYERALRLISQVNIGMSGEACDCGGDRIASSTLDAQ